MVLCCGSLLWFFVVVVCCFSVCVFCLCFLFVFSVCVFCLCFLFVFSVSGRTAREGQDDDEENMGTSIACSATGRSKRRKNSSTLSTNCGTGASRVCTAGQTSAICSTTCRTNTTCLPATSDRGAGKPPAGRGVVRNFAVWYNSCSSPCTVLVPCFCPRRAACVVPTLPKEWCCTEARTIWIAICSWRQNERNLRSRRTRAAPACSPCTGMSTTGLSTETGLTKRKRNLVEPGGGGGAGGGGGGGADIV